MESIILGKEWRFPSQEMEEVRELARCCRLPLFMAQFLYNRGIREKEAVLAHLSPTLSSLNDPFSMAGMGRAVERLLEAVRRREKVAVYGDYDVDGVCAAAVVYLYLRELGLDVSVYIPHRVREGYGLNSEAVRSVAGQGCSLLLTVDCGISNRDEVALANSLGMDVIVTDHHESPAELPPALAVIDPKQPGCAYPFKGLAGVGVAFNLVRALRSRLFQNGHWEGCGVPNLKRYLDLVALGTVADMVPLQSDNRILVRAGLDVLATTDRKGLAALKEVSGMNGAKVTTFDVGFRLGPRINAAGRMAHAMDAFRMLVSDDRAEAADLAQRLHGLNQSRQGLEGTMLRSALSLAEEYGDRPAYVLSSKEWSLGVVGIVASKLSDRLRRPVVLLAEEGEVAKGSGRAPESVDLYSAIACCKEVLLGFGGHRSAAGVTLNVKDIPEFRVRFEAAVASQAPDVPGPALEVDGFMGVEEFCDPALAGLLDLLGPFGVEYPEPLVALRRFCVMERRTVGNGKHMKLRLAPASSCGMGSVDLLGWRHGDKLHLPWERLELLCAPYVNTFQGRQSVALELRDARESMPGDETP